MSDVDSHSLALTADALLSPKSIAVIGASTKKVTYGNIFIRRLEKYGYEGTIYPIHPTADAIEGVPAYPSFEELPDDIDYAYIAVPPQKASAVLADAGGRLRFAHVISSGFGEVPEGRALEVELVREARRHHIRLLGPNCLGIHTPRGKVTFADPENLSAETGSVAMISQSGSLATDVLRRGTLNGIKFSGVVSVGNSADIGPNELLELFLADPETSSIGIYLEDVKDGRAFFEILRAANARKPVILLIGGRTRQGQAAAASHTGALAQDDNLWIALAKQTGAILTDSLEEFIEVLLVFQMCRPRTGPPRGEVTLFGNGGGISVLATDYFSRLGLDISPFDDAVVAPLEELELPPGTSVANPIDTPLGTFRVRDGHIAGTIIDLVLAKANPDAVVMHLNLPAIVPFAKEIGVNLLDNLMRSALHAIAPHRAETHFLLVLRSNGNPEIERRKLAERQRAAELGIPVFDEYTGAARALAALETYEARKHRLTTFSALTSAR